MCSDRPDSQKTRLVVHQVMRWHVLSCTKIKTNKQTNMRTQRPCTAQNKHRAVWNVGEWCDVTGASMLLLLLLLLLVSHSLSHSSHQVKHLEPYKGIFRLWWGANSLCGQWGEGPRSPVLPGPTISTGVEYWVAETRGSWRQEPGCKW